MHKILILFFSISVYVQSQNDFHTTDSITYAHFQNQEWDKLIIVGKQALANDVDFKYLRQRLGYAYYFKADYFNAIKQYEKSLIFDPYDEISHLYLYYLGLHTANKAFAQYHASKLSVDMQRQIGFKNFNVLDALDFEYNKKINDVDLRSNPDYVRFGLSSQFGGRFQLYQSLSKYSQTIENVYLTKQNEYYALFGFSLTDKTALSVGYHYVDTNIDSAGYVLKIPAKVLFANLKMYINRFDLAFSSSVFSNEFVETTQIGAQIGVSFSGKYHPYLRTSIYKLNEYDTNRIVLSEMAGIMLFKNVWIEGTLTIGNLNNYVDANGLYLYNSFDQTVFRTGMSAYLYATKKIIFFTNYTYDNKLIINTSTNYNQNSITGGIIWNL